MKDMKFVTVGFLIIFILFCSQIAVGLTIESKDAKNGESISLSQLFFTGKVTTTSGEPISEARIEIREEYEDPITYSTLTNREGVYLVPLVRLVTNNYYVTASKPGYYTQTKHISINTSVGFVYVNFTLIKKTRAVDLLHIIKSKICFRPIQFLSSFHNF